MEDQLVNVGIWTAIIMVAIAVISAVLLPIINSMSHPESLIKPVIAIVIVGVLFLVSYLISGNEVTPKYITYNVTTAGESQLVGGGLTMTFLLFAVAAIGVVFSEVNKALKS